MERGTRRKRFQESAQSVKLSDVAALAGVSPATASRALNTPDKVSADMRDRVRAAATKLGYVPDAAARALASRRSRTIGAVVPTLDNPIFATGVQKLESRLNERGYALVVAGSDYRMDKELRQATNLLERGIEGLMLTGTEHHPSLHVMLETRGVPHVNTWVDEGDAAHPCIGFDNVEVAVRLTSYLLDLGHTRFAMIAGIAEGNDRAAARAVGVREALARRGLRLEDGRLIEEPYGVSEGRDGLRAVLAGPPEQRPTAVICGNDLLAFGAIFEAAAMGLDVPGDLSVVGFDDAELSSHIPPGLTTMHVPSGEMGALAADYLVNRIEGKPARHRTRVEVRLVVRGSTAPPRG
ncbi:MAG: substrate-binding domain-containing protein [Alphaproteobacteria bacterium]|nr:substrate-binding domain-containing protein [Alphaproteobacteria bacterium]